MDWSAFKLSLQLAVCTVLLLLPLAVLTARWMITLPARRKSVVEALLTVPLILPPTVMGFFLLVSMSDAHVVGRIWRSLFDQSLVFSFEGLLVASVIVNIPFAIQPALRAFESIGSDLREAAQTCGMSRWRSFKRIEFPLAWPGILTGGVLTFAHTLGEFGVVLMVGGNIPGETRTVSIAIYDQVQSFDNSSAAVMSLILLTISVFAIAVTFLLTRKASVGARAENAGGGRYRGCIPSRSARLAKHRFPRRARRAGCAGRSVGEWQVDHTARHRGARETARGQHRGWQATVVRQQ